MVIWIIPPVFTFFALILLKYLQYKSKLNNLKVILIIFGINLLFIFLLVALSMIIDSINEKKFYAIIDPTGENDGIYNRDSLTEEEKIFVDRFIGDGGRNVGRIIYIIYCIINFIIFSIFSKYIDFRDILEIDT